MKEENGTNMLFKMRKLIPKVFFKTIGIPVAVWLCWSGLSNNSTELVLLAIVAMMYVIVVNLEIVDVLSLGLSKLREIVYD